MADKVHSNHPKYWEYVHMHLEQTFELQYIWPDLHFISTPCLDILVMVYRSTPYHSQTVCWNVGRLIDKRSNSVEITRWATVSELDTWTAASKMSAVFMEAADRSSQARIPPVAFWHCLCHCVYPLRVCECLVIKNFPRCCYAKNSHLGTCSETTTTISTISTNRKNPLYFPWFSPCALCLPTS